MSLIDAMIRIREILPRQYWVTNETLRRHEKGVVAPDQADPLLVGAMAVAYDTSVTELLPAAADQLGDIYHLLEKINETHLRPGPDGGGGGRPLTIG